MKAFCYYLVALFSFLSLPLLSELASAIPAESESRSGSEDTIKIAVIGASLSSLAHLHYLAASLPASICSRLSIAIFEGAGSISDPLSDDPLNVFSTDHLAHKLLHELGLAQKTKTHANASTNDNVGIWNANASLEHGKDWTIQYPGHFRESTMGLTSFLTQLVRAYGFSPVLQLYRHLSTVHARLSAMAEKGSAAMLYESLDEWLRKLDFPIPFASMTLSELFKDNIFVREFLDPLLRKYGSARDMNALGALVLLTREIYMKPGLSFFSLPSRDPLATTLLSRLRQSVKRVELFLGSPVEKVTSIWTLASETNEEPRSRFQIHVQKTSQASHHDDATLYEKLIFATPIAQLPPFYYLRVRAQSTPSDIGGEYDPTWKDYKARFLYEQTHCLRVASPKGLDPVFFERQKASSSSSSLSAQKDWWSSWSWPFASAAALPPTALPSQEAGKEKTPAVPSTILTTRNGHGLLSIFKKDTDTFEIRSTATLSKTLLAKLFLDEHVKVVRESILLSPCSKQHQGAGSSSSSSSSNGDVGGSSSRSRIETESPEQPVPASRFPSLSPAKDAYLLSSVDALVNTRDHLELLLMHAKNMARMIGERILQEQTEAQ